MQIRLGTVPAGTIIEEAGFTDLGDYNLILKLPNGTRHRVMGDSVLGVWEAMMDWLNETRENKG